MPFRAAIVAGAVLAVLAAGSAPAATLCVEPRTGCETASHPTIAAALAAAAAVPGTDRVLLGLATYEESVVLQDVELEGFGGSGSILTPAAAGTAPAITVLENASASKLGVHVTAGTGLRVAGTVEDVRVTAPDDAPSVVGIQLTGTARRVDVRLATGTRSTGVRGSGGGLLEDSEVRAQDAVLDVATVRRTRVTGGVYGLHYDETGAALLEDVLVLGEGGNSTGVAFISQDEDRTATLRHVTVSGAAVGLRTYATGQSGSALVKVVDSVLHGNGTDILAGTAAGRPTTVQLDHSAYGSVESEGATVTSGPGTQVLAASPFVSTDPAGDLAFRPRHDAVLRNGGTPGTLGALESATDLDGDPRIVEGRRDIGALEYQNRAPLAGFFIVFGAGTPDQAIPPSCPSSAPPATPTATPSRACSTGATAPATPTRRTPTRRRGGSS
jgi:hypothetical protein